MARFWPLAGDRFLGNKVLECDAMPMSKCGILCFCKDLRLTVQDQGVNPMSCLGRDYLKVGYYTEV
jgi:hypothetical protein